ncbi:hypothetical protein RUM43_008474 [Polyplax serrata]|uniref:RUN domain-containing protein n=1 Tax=Polyplax serrata TaxID=468196 RepID=A0AAN8NUB4_POLSC
MAQENPDCQELLHLLKVTVEGLLVNQVRNVWNIYGGLNRLYFTIEKIFKHGCKINKEGSTSCWQFIEGISRLQPSLLTDFSYTKDSYGNLPANIKNDKSLVWIYKTLQEHLLSKKLFWLLSDSKHVAACYNENAFFRQEKYAEAAILCLKAVEQKQPSLLSEIDPSLYVIDPVPTKFQKYHKRCSSLPEVKYQFFTGLEDKKFLQPQRETDNYKPVEDDIALNGQKLLNLENSEAVCLPSSKQLGKLYNSLPNLIQEVFEEETIPNVPSCSNLPENILQIHYEVDNSKFSGPEISPVPCVRLKQNVKKKGSFLQDEVREWFIVQGKKEERKKTFMQDGGTSVLPMSTGYFPRPVQGQSLTSFLSSEHFSRTVAELDRENAHFSISEAMISAIEQMKCNRQLRLVEDVNEDDSDVEINQLKQRIRLRRRQRLEEKHLKHLWSTSLLSDGKTDTATDQSVSPLSTSPGTPSESLSTDDVDDLEVDEGSNLKYLKQSDLSVSMASLYSEADVSKVKDGTESSANAENVALSLLKQFKKKQLPRASDLEWLVSEKDAPQDLLPLPKSWPVSPDDAEKAGTPFLRGTTDWAPPRPQVIFTQHPSPVRRILMEKQNYRCAGCGLRVATEYSHKFRYCEYLGRYFCTGCHSNQLSVIPGHVLFKWSFKRYPVATFSYRLIDQMATDPLFPLKDLNPGLYKKVKLLERTRQLRMQLYYLKDFMFTCRFAQQHQEDLEKESPHMFRDPEMYSLQDLIQIKTGELLSRLKDLVKDCLNHVQQCQLCSARGFVCELCPSKDVIYPWFIDKVSKCSQCGACFHYQCFKSGFCPRCARATARRQSAINSDF